MGKPAARLSDMANDCGDPVDAPTGTVIAVSTVLINNLPAAKQDDQIIGVDIHIVMVPSPAGPVPTPLPHPFVGMIDGELSSSVQIMGKAAATVGSTATNNPSHIPTPPGTAFQKPPMNKSKIIMGSPNVLIGNGGGGSGGGSGGGEGVAESSADEAAVEEGHTLQVKFVDKGGKPITGVKYSVKSPDNQVSTGSLSGEVKKSGVKEGDHEISLQAITSASWSTKTAKVGETVQLQADISGFDSGTEAVFQIFKQSTSSADEQMDTVKAESSGDKVEADWQFEYQGDTGNPSLGKKRAGKYSNPRFYFIVDVDGSRARSGVLEITDSLKIVLKDENGNPIADEEYVVHFANGEVRRGTLDQNGEAVENRIPTEKSRVVFPNTSGAKKLPG